MKKILVISLFLTLQSLGITQSLEDLKKLEELKKQIDTSGLGTELKKTTPVKESPSMVQFRDSVNTMPKIINEDVSTTEPEKSTLPVFGLDVFQNAKFDLNPEIYGPVNEDYPLAPGDEIVITVWGEVELRNEYIINRAGQIYIEKVGIVTVAGKTLKSLQNELKIKMGKSYSSISKGKSFVDVTLSKLRSIRIFVVGNVKNPGVFVVPAISSPFHALFYAGGVKENGSLRQINLVRNDKIFESLDFYKFLTEGNSFARLRMQNNDVIVVPPRMNAITLKGAVKQEASYELKKGEGLVDLIYYSGGITPQSYIDKIRITRFVDQKDIRVFDANLRTIVEQKKNFELFDGDLVEVERLNRVLRNFVTISGPIYGPTRFQYTNGLTLRELFSKVDSIAGDAFLNRVEITRVLKNRKKSVFAIDLNAVLSGNSADIELQPEDHIQIKSILNLYPTKKVRIFGAVKNPGYYDFKSHMTLKDLIFSAGGFSLNAQISEAEISRVYPVKSNGNKLAEILFVALDSNYGKSTSSADDLFLLKPMDNVFIRSLSDWKPQRNATILGEVVSPGTYSLKSKKETVYDLIKRAGGLKTSAYLKGGKLSRSENNIGQIGIDFESIVNNPTGPDNIYLRDGDVITIPEISNTVKVEGGVVFPSSILFEKSYSLDDYIEAAGGFSDMADLDHISITLANGRRIMQQKFLFWSYLPEEITAGSIIYVPVLSESDDIDWSSTIRDVAAILGSVATTILIIDRIGR